jgi:phosphatidate cytidylyltransferase
LRAELIDSPCPESAGTGLPPTPRRRGELALRLVSAFVLLPIVMALIARGGVPFALLLGAVAACSVYEVCAMALQPFPRVAWVAVLSAAALPVFSRLRPDPFSALLLGFALASLLSMGAGFGSALLSEDPPAALPRPIWMGASLIYCALPLGLIGLLRASPEGGWWVLLACTVTWMNDTGAYFAGRAFGRHKLLPKVSPRKTWEGFLGGLAASIASALILRGLGFHALSFWECGVLGLLAGVIGPMGDLSESLLKRALGFKDSGRLMPGHGGILDRIDALLFNAVLVFAFASVLGRL